MTWKELAAEINEWPDNLQNSPVICFDQIALDFHVYEAVNFIIRGEHDLLPEGSFYLSNNHLLDDEGKD